MTPAHDVFISYSTRDKQWADAACATLEAGKVRCWIAPRDILPGTEWGASIIQGIDGCRVMVLVFSTSANESAQVRREVERAISKGIPVLPFRVENVMPAGAMEYALGNTHWLDAFTPPVEKQMTALTDAVVALLATRPRAGQPSPPPAAPKPAPPRPPAPPPPPPPPVPAREGGSALPPSAGEAARPAEPVRRAVPLPRANIVRRFARKRPATDTPTPIDPGPMPTIHWVWAAFGLVQFLLLLVFLFGAKGSTEPDPITGKTSISHLQGFAICFGVIGLPGAVTLLVVGLRGLIVGPTVSAAVPGVTVQVIALSYLLFALIVDGMGYKLLAGVPAVGLLATGVLAFRHGRRQYAADAQAATDPDD